MIHMPDLLLRKPPCRRDVFEVAATAVEVASLPAVGAVPAMGTAAGKARDAIDKMLRRAVDARV